MSASAQRVTHGGNVDAAVRDVDLDDLHTYAHLSFDLDTVGEYRRAQRQLREEGTDHGQIENWQVQARG